MSFNFTSLMKIGRQRRLRKRQPKPTPTDMLELRLQKLEKFGVKNSFEHGVVANTNRRITSEQQSKKILNRNIMLGQIEHFYEGGGTLKSLQPQQRYIVSPHDDIRNLYENTVGMSTFGMEKGLSAIRPVFKDENQRKNFHQKITQDLTGFSGSQHKLAALQKLQSWSASGTAMTDFSSVNTKRSHPIVYTQGHGLPGKQHILSDSGQPVTANTVGQMLHDMGLPALSEVRANSCFSGTERQITSSDLNVEKNFKQQTLEYNAGRWAHTFAGGLEKKLRSLGRRNRVAGYMGPTSKRAMSVKEVIFGTFIKQSRGMASPIKTPFKYDDRLRRQMRRRGNSFTG